MQQHDQQYPEGFRVPIGEIGRAFMLVVAITKHSLSTPEVNSIDQHAHACIEQ
jgi:hypothetical protein